MPALVACIHVLTALQQQNVDGRDEPGHAVWSGWYQGLLLLRALDFLAQHFQFQPAMLGLVQRFVGLGDRR